MQRFSAILKLVSSLVVAAGFCAPAFAGTLYQWTGKDGTPTYSPDPPPAGVEYQLVGADLKPLPKNIDMANQAAAAIPTKKASQSSVASTQVLPAASPAVSKQVPQQVAQQAPKKPAVPWKPVRYANDPTPRAKTPVKTSQKTTVDPVAIARKSPACVQAKQQMALLEGQFAQAITDEQMDRAVLQLSQHKPTLQSACMIK